MSDWDIPPVPEDGDSEYEHQMFEKISGISILPYVALANSKACVHAYQTRLLFILNNF